METKKIGERVINKSNERGTQHFSHHQLVFGGVPDAGCTRMDKHTMTEGPAIITMHIITQYLRQRVNMRETRESHPASQTTTKQESILSI